MIATFFSLWWLGDKHWSGFVVGAMAALLGGVWFFDWKRTSALRKSRIFFCEYPRIHKVEKEL